MAHLGFVGLGAMGGRIAQRLLDKGHVVSGYNRTRAKADWLIAKGLRWVDTPRAATAAADVTFVMVTDSAALDAVAGGADGLLAGLGPGKTLVDMSTVSPITSRALAEQVRGVGADMLDVPVSGSPLTIEQGKLTMMVGGGPEVYEAIKPLLLEIGPKATYVGENGLAVTMKLAINVSLGAQMLAFSEGVLLAEKAGIPRATAVEVLTTSAIASPMVQYRGPMVLGLPEHAWFSMTLMQKDAALALDLGRRLGVPLPTTAVANEFLTAARAMGLGEHDFAAVFHVLAGLAGVKA